MKRNDSRQPNDEAARRKRAARTAWIIAAIAALVYFGFVLTVMFAHQP